MLQIFINNVVGWEGQINATHIATKFELSRQAASGILKQYRAEFPTYLVYDSSQKAYLATPKFNDAFIHSIQIAKDKAYTSASFGFATNQWTDIFKEAPHLEQGFSNRNRLIPFGGGLPIFENSVKVGAIGVSGGTEEEDIICAQYAIEKIGLQ